MNRENAITQYVEDESARYFERLDHVNHKFAKCFCSQVICSTIGDAYDLFFYVGGNQNPFYQNVHQLDAAKGRQLYKWLGFYHTILYVTNNPPQSRSIIDAMTLVFNWSKQDKRTMRHFMSIHAKCPAIFEVQFAKKMVANLFHAPFASPVALALASNLIYNAHTDFLQQLAKNNVKNAICAESKAGYVSVAHVSI